MKRPGNMSSLGEELQRRAEEDREQIERYRKRTESILSAALATLSENLRRRVGDEARSIERAMESFNRGAVAVLKRLGLLGWALGLSVSLGILSGNWALQWWQSSRIESLMQRRAQLEAEIGRFEATVERLKDQTGGVQLVEDDQGPLVVLPPGALENPRWTVGGLPAVPLPRK